MLNYTSSRSLSSSGYYDARLRRQQLYRAAKNGGRKHATRHKERHFPFHHLPSEIIAEIFVLCLPDSERFFNSIKSKDAAPLLLCNVSSSWRSLVLSIPRLWNKLCIRIENPKVDIDLATAMADSWIARSGELPLSLRLHCYGWNEKEKVTAMVQAHLNTFFRYASRWESVDITLFGCSPVSFPNFGPTPLLRKFSYSTSCRVSVPFPFTSCPLLSNITWPFSCFVASNRDPDIPWHQLTHINLKHIISAHQTLDILRTCQMLVEFNVEIDDDLSLEVRSRRKPVENQSLRSFQICVYIACPGLLESLILPALTDFSLYTDFDIHSYILPRSVHPQLLRLFTRSKCKLEKLSLENCGFNDAGILKCLKHDSCSSLTELEIVNDFDRPMFTDRVIRALTNKDGLSEGNNVLLPKLSCLSLEMCVSASPGILGLMIITRCLWWDKDNQLKSLSLTVRDDLDDIDEAFLKIAEESGLEVEITNMKCDTDSESTEDLYDTDDS
ncbi:hypothetical protein M378DRAFT_22897 [Amanita muscaria Koide BX008]|uniref:Uncharacterized protein n=1 Tax=Amanita muscaria (strain Koide BX008) TaxID=946122 RepID=A0A0C2SV52_AMAMK|nr:hypothetical protein M378DRAFT_22897 [Amanita muscaria Koide BX008]